MKKLKLSQMKLTARLSEWCTNEINEAKEWTKEHYKYYRVVPNHVHQVVEIYGYEKK